jgi:tryptophan synthase alpha chain
MSRITERFAELKKEGRTALIPFFVPGVPACVSIEEIILGLEEAGADLIEIGVPFSDPVADGPVIQRADEKALVGGMNLDTILSAVTNVRSKTATPLLLLIYFNTVHHYGCGRFASACLDVGVDGLIVPDLPYEEQGELREPLLGMPIDLIPLVSMTSRDRLPMILHDARGFVYCVSTTGVTGERGELNERLSGFLADVRDITHTPRAVGFGISTPEQVRYLRDHCEGVIIGSALVRRLLDEGMESGMNFVRSLRKVLDV